MKSAAAGGSASLDNRRRQVSRFLWQKPRVPAEAEAAAEAAAAGSFSAEGTATIARKAFHMTHFT